MNNFEKEIRSQNNDKCEDFDTQQSVDTNKQDNPNTKQEKMNSDTSINERHKVEITREDMELSEKDFLKKYSVSRATYYRAKSLFKKTGNASIFIGYHKKETSPLQNGGFPEYINEKDIITEARSHAIYFLKKYGMNTSENDIVDEVAQEIIVRFLEMAGDESFSEELYRMTLSQNVVRNYVNKERGYRNKVTDAIIDINAIVTQGLKQEQQYFVEDIIQKVHNPEDQKILLEYLVFNTVDSPDVQRILDENNLREYFN